MPDNRQIVELCKLWDNPCRPEVCDGYDTTCPKYREIMGKSDVHPSGKRHDLKTWPVYFNAIWKGLKTFEVRLNDRRFRYGDLLILREWDPLLEEYSGQVVEAIVTYICRLPQPLRDYVGMQIEVITTGDNSYPEGCKNAR